MPEYTLVVPAYSNSEVVEHFTVHTHVLGKAIAEAKKSIPYFNDFPDDLYDWPHAVLYEGEV